MKHGVGLLAFVTAALALAAGAGASSRDYPLHPLSERDMASTKEMGCTCTFSTRRATFIQMIGHDFMVRTRAGLTVCPITDKQFTALSGGSGSMSCGGKRLRLKPTGPVIGHEESDSASGPASLTVSQGGRSQVMRGEWGCAC